MLVRPLAMAGAALLLLSCGSAPPEQPVIHSAVEETSSRSVDPSATLMPDLVGLPAMTASRRLGRILTADGTGLSSGWTREVVRCGARPGTVVRQRPQAGTPVQAGTEVEIRTAGLDLRRFRGPCEPEDGDLGPVRGADAELARAFYRFAAEPRRDGPFAEGDVWAGIGEGPASVDVGQSERGDLAAWEIDADYAERLGPFSALDVVAASGGYYELHRGIVPTCPGTSDAGAAPPDLEGLRAITLTSPADVTVACMEGWGVTLFLEDDGRIRGVALRLGAP